MKGQLMFSITDYEPNQMLQLIEALVTAWAYLAVAGALLMVVLMPLVMLFRT